MNEADRLAAIRRRLAAATEGPWAVTGSGRSIYAVDPETGLPRARGQRSTGDSFPNVGRCDGFGDAEFVAASREDVPYLLAAIEERDRVIADMMQDDGFRLGVREGLRLACERLDEVAARYTALGWEGAFRLVSAHVCALEPAESLLPPDRLRERCERLEAALRRVTTGDYPAERQASDVAREALGGADRG